MTDFLHDRKGYHEDDERLASLSPPRRQPFIRAPPPPHELHAPLTSDDHLFQTIHFAPAPDIDTEKYRLVIDISALRNPFPSNKTTDAPPTVLSLADIKALPSMDLTSFHECYGPPTLKPDTNRWRIGCVRWTGVKLRTLLNHAGLSPSILCIFHSENGGSPYLWADGLDRGTFAGSSSDRYRKDIPLKKALCDEVLVAYAMNGLPLSKERGGPVRLVVSGWFGTCSVKWLCKVQVQVGRAEGMFSRGRFYNEEVGDEMARYLGKVEGERMGWWKKDLGGEGEGGKVWMKPVWRVDVNSLMYKPMPDACFLREQGRETTDVEVEGWAWSDEGVRAVEVSLDQGKTWDEAEVQMRREREWQQFRTSLRVRQGQWTIIARAECKSGQKQPLTGRRNHVHSVRFRVE